MGKIIGISLNEVLRGFISQFQYTYNKYIGEMNLKYDEIDNFNLIEFFKFKNIDEMNKFLYQEAALETFGHADQLHDGLMNKFNNFIMDIEDDGEHEIKIISREAASSIPSTLFFLSKTGCKATDIKFVTKHEDKWKHVDILITANPKTLEAKPSDKISVKINAPYNKDVKADFELDNIIDLIKDKALQEKIFNTTITTYEEIN